MPKLGDPTKDRYGPRAIAPVGQLNELHQSNDPQVRMTQYAPKSKLRRYSINSSYNINDVFQTLRDSSLIGAGSRLGNIARSQENHLARLYGAASDEKHCLPDELSVSSGRPSSRFIPATRLPFRARRCLLLKSRCI